MQSVQQKKQKDDPCYSSTWKHCTSRSYYSYLLCITLFRGNRIYDPNYTRTPTFITLPNTSIFHCSASGISVDLRRDHALRSAVFLSHPTSLSHISRQLVQRSGVPWIGTALQCLGRLTEISISITTWRKLPNPSTLFISRYVGKPPGPLRGRGKNKKLAKNDPRWCITGNHYVAFEYKYTGCNAMGSYPVSSSVAEYSRLRHQLIDLSHHTCLRGLISRFVCLTTLL